MFSIFDFEKLLSRYYWKFLFLFSMSIYLPRYNSESTAVIILYVGEYIFTTHPHNLCFCDGVHLVFARVVVWLILICFIIHLYFLFLFFSVYFYSLDAPFCIFQLLLKFLIFITFLDSHIYLFKVISSYINYLALPNC